LKKSLIIFALLVFSLSFIQGQVSQIAIPRIEAMPNLPSPYNMRDWKDVAVKFDEFVFDETKRGPYLPLVTYGVGSNSFPNLPKVSLHTYVGTNTPNGNEAINVMPAIVGASLVGIDHRVHKGRDLVAMTQHFFAKANGLQIYFNNIGGSGSNDWWYDNMPNIYFYQLYDLYPNYREETQSQFLSIADQFAHAVKLMGGSAIPWQKAYMNYRAWDFQTLQPLSVGVPEPEAAGAYGWLLYHAYKTIKDRKYLQSAEWAMEFLDEWTQNPSYELQLPYGTYIAAKMNAELGTDYDIEKFVNWSFDRGALRGWGTIVGKWGGLDVSGLVGEANDKGNDYAFILNGVQQAAALVPMLRYDKRFAGAIGKWVLNLSNASRLFYSNFLPASLQDGREWSEQNDPDNVLAHEAIREQSGGKSPFAMGDAVGGKWAATNYSLYSSSSIGYLGSIVSKTNVDKILRLDLNATDFFAEESYPSFLLYNPYVISQTVMVDFGSEATDLYETLSETFEGKNLSGQISIELAPYETKILVQTPVGGVISIDQNRLLVDSIVVDYQQTKVAYTQKPRIKAVAANRYIIEKGDTTRIFGTYVDEDSDEVMIEWNADQDSIQGSGSEVIFRAADQEGIRKVKLKVTDESGNVDSLEIELSIVAKINKAPQILELVKSAEYVEPNGTIEVLCQAVDLDLDEINFTWTANGGSFMGLDSLVEWKAPASEGIYTINVKVTDSLGLSSSTSTQILVKNFLATTGKTIASYPFSGNANDNSGNGLNGTTVGTILAPDRFENIRNAYYFNGGSQHIRVINDPKLNFQGACTISFWMKASNLVDRESFLVSHGSWQNRYKVSLTPSAQLRWTINTTGGIKDLDSNEAIEAEKYYHCAVTYDGKLMAVYINGTLSNYVNQSGLIKQTNVNLLMGQMLPDDANYNFKGYLDDVTIFDHAKIPVEIEAIYQNELTAIHELEISSAYSVTPNPAYSTITIQSLKGQIGHTSGYEVTIFNQLGQRVKSAQNYYLGSAIEISTLSNGLYFLRLEKANDIINSSFLIHKI